MTGGAAALLHPHLARHEIDLVMDDENLVQRDLVELGSSLYRAAGLVHVGLGLQDQKLVAGKIAFRCRALEARTPGAESVAADDGVRRQESDIVPVERVAAPGIAQADDEAQGRLL